MQELTVQQPPFSPLRREPAPRLNLHDAKFYPNAEIDTE
jgi:hypothetical protein